MVSKTVDEGSIPSRFAKVKMNCKHESITIVVNKNNDYESIDCNDCGITITEDDFKNGNYKSVLIIEDRYVYKLYNK